MGKKRTKRQAVAPTLGERIGQVARKVSRVLHSGMPTGGRHGSKAHYTRKVKHKGRDDAP